MGILARRITRRVIRQDRLICRKQRQMCHIDMSKIHFQKEHAQCSLKITMTKTQHWQIVEVKNYEMHNQTLFLHSAPYLSSVFTKLSRQTTTCGQKIGESQMESFKEECGNQSVLDVIGRSVPSSPSLSQTTPISPHPALLRPRLG